jgi:hypothetical protein
MQDSQIQTDDQGASSLQRLVRPFDGPSAAVRIRVMKRDRFQCTYCGVPGTDAELEVDHIIPKAKGGSHHMSNLTTACRKCNQEKSDGAVPEKRMSAMTGGPVGMFVHVLKDGQIHNQGRVISHDAEFVLLQRYGWIDGRPTDVIALPKSRLYDEAECAMYSEREDMLEAWERFCRRRENALA